MLSRHEPAAFTARATLAAALLLTTAATPVSDTLLHGLTWRNLGPFRGGRISAASGAVGETGTFYVGLPAGGVWKTTSAGETWFPVFDAITSSSSVGAIAVAPSNANVVYVGMGDQPLDGLLELSEGDGIYRSSDAGKTWHHLGLADSKRIPSIIVDPRDENVVLAATLGPQFQKAETRGVFRSTDGGTTWTKTLSVSDSTGVWKLAIAHDRPQVVFATTAVILRATSPPERRRHHQTTRAENTDRRRHLQVG